MGYMLPKALETLWNVLVARYPSVSVRSLRILTLLRKVLPQNDTNSEKVMVVLVLIGAAAIVALEACKKGRDEGKKSVYRKP